jgi:group I intron endonuclease
MSKLFHVYAITNNINKKVYIGKTSGDYHRRWKKHCKIAEGKGSYASYTKYAIHLAITKYGINNFSFAILQSFHAEDEAFQFEIECIQKYDSIKNGYNIAIGGKSGGSGENSNVSIFSNDDVISIFTDFTNGLNGAKISKKYGCSKTTIYDIVNGITYCSVDVDKSLRDKAIQIIFSQKKTPTDQLSVQKISDDYLKGLSYRQLAKKYNTSTFSVQKLIKLVIDQSIIDENKMQPINDLFGNQIIEEYIKTDITAIGLGNKYSISKHVVYDILRGKTFHIENSKLQLIKAVKKAKSARKINVKIK